MKEPNFVCESCGVVGYKIPSELKRRKNNFCSKKCSYKFQSKRIEKKCDYCGDVFLKRLSQALRFKNHFCSKECRDKFKDKKEDVICLECGIEFKKGQCDIKRFPRHFCSDICRKNINKHKDWGSSRSKLEIAIEEHFKVVFPFMSIDYNKTHKGYELDIFIPCLDLAIEINGITHYKPIYGDKIFIRRQQIDKEKLIKCMELDIKLFVINVSEDGENVRIQEQRISEVEQIVRDRINELGYVFKSKQMVMNI